MLAAPLAILLQPDAGDAGFWVAGDGPLLLVLVGEVAQEAARLEAHVFSWVGALCVHGADFDGAVADAAHDLEGVYVRVANVVCEVHLGLSCLALLPASYLRLVAFRYKPLFEDSVNFFYFFIPPLARPRLGLFRRGVSPGRVAG